jgi:glutamate synthase (NADPH/NADH) small chain
LDCCRMALRLGAREVWCLYRRSRSEMRGNPRDAELALEEGATFHWLASPLEILADEGGRVRGVRCVRNRRGRSMDPGRAPPDPIPGSEFEFPADTVVLALGYTPDPALTLETPGLESRLSGLVVVDPSTGRTAKERVWAGGDNVTGPSRVAAAVAQGRKAATDIHQRLSWGTARAGSLS